MQQKKSGGGMKMAVVCTMFPALAVNAGAGCGEDNCESDVSGTPESVVEDNAMLQEEVGAEDGGTSEATASADISVCDPAKGPFTLEIDNEFFPLPVAKKLTLEGEEDGATLQVIFSVLDETETVAGVVTRVVEERESEDGELVEISRNFFAQAPDGTVCYFGEDVDIYEDGKVVEHEGEWRAGEGENKPGIIMPAALSIGMEYQQEVAPGVAEDTGKVTAMGDKLSVPAGDFEDTLTVWETSPLDSGGSTKVYVRGIGMAFDDGIELIAYE
jgi:hypothetical protein